MSRSLATRVARLEASVGWQLTVVRQRNGAELFVPSTLLIDAWLRIVCGTGSLDLHPKLSRFIAFSVLPRQASEIERGVWEACRAIWIPQEAEA